MYTIGKFSKITGISIDTLRYYNKIGLLNPEMKNPSNGYRYYTHTQLLQADVIKVCRGMDMSIESIKESLQRQNSQEFQLLLKNQGTQMHKKIQELEGALNQITHISKRIEEWERIKGEEESYCRNLPMRALVTSAPFSFEAKEDYDVSHLYMELMHWLRLHQIEIQYNGGYLYTIKNGQISEVRICEIFDTRLEIEDPRIINLQKGAYQCKKYVKQDREEVLAGFMKQLKRDKKQDIYLLDHYFLSGNFNYSNRFFELQVPAHVWIKERRTLSIV